MPATAATYLSGTAAVADRPTTGKVFAIGEGEGPPANPKAGALLQSRGAFVQRIRICHKAA
jgi:hypothetical protein